MANDKDPEVITGGGEGGVVRAERDRFSEISDGARVVVLGSKDGREVDPRLGIARLQLNGLFKVGDRGGAAIRNK